MGLGRALAGDYWGLLLAVMLFGIGGPIVSSGAPKIVASIFQGSQRGLAMGIYMTGPTLGGILALTLTHPVLLPLFDGSWRAVRRRLWCGRGASRCRRARPRVVMIPLPSRIAAAGCR